MSQKRKHVEAGDTATDAPKGKKQRPFHARSRGPKKSNTAQSDSNTDSTGALKRRIRDLKRVLSHADNNATKKMPATVRIVQERELEACEHELAEKLAHKQETDFRTKIIGKYHHIRFFGQSTVQFLHSIAHAQASNANGTQNGKRPRALSNDFASSLLN
jgi:hypothetical protein